MRRLLQPASCLELLPWGGPIAEASSPVTSLSYLLRAAEWEVVYVGCRLCVRVVSEHCGHWPRGRVSSRRVLVHLGVAQSHGLHTLSSSRVDVFVRPDQVAWLGTGH